MLKAFLLIVVGLAGDPEHGKTFHAWGTRLAEASERLGVPAERLVYLVDAPAEGDKRVSGRATREEITKALEGFGKQAGPEDLVFITLIGHGTVGNRGALFNLPGPDMGPADFDALLKQLPTKQIVFVNTASASAPFVETLSGPGRTIVSATRTGGQHFATVFGGHFVDALTSDAADADKNKRISVLEAFTYARTEVKRSFEREGFLPTEQALLDDNGDKEGTQEPTAAGPDGKVAAVLSLGTTGGDTLPADPKLRALYVERRDLERRVESLRLLKEGMDPAKYTSELEKLVTAIALKTREIRQAETTK
jgi:hypothetical protein